MEKNYSVTLNHSNKELSKRDILRYSDFSNSSRLVDLVSQDSPFVVEVDNLIVFDVHNGNAKNDQSTDYTVIILVDKSGNSYSSSSSSLLESATEIMEVMGGEEYSIEIKEIPSKNFNGKGFLKASIV